MISATRQQELSPSVSRNRKPNRRGGYVLIQLEPTASPNLGRSIGNLEMVLNAEMLTGPYDLIVTPQDGIGVQELTNVLANVPGVLRALACEPAA